MTLPVAYTVFHINLAFSSIDENDHPAVVERCYWPLLRLAEAGIPIGIEATAYTLLKIKAVDPTWLEAARGLIAKGMVEFVGSGYCQIIAPLVPAELTHQNLRLGLEEYQKLLGVTPRVALINEQAYSPGILPLYHEAGFEAIMMDWAEPASHNPNWSRSFVDRPQLVEGNDGAVLPVLWSDAISFQKFQRYAHEELSAEEYFEFLTQQIVRGARALPLYTSDAEVFDYRPGRFASEASMAGLGEFERIRLLLTSLKASNEIEIALPSHALATLQQDRAPLRLETTQVAVPVKKQRKYNLTRWAVTGRGDLLLNTHCWRLFERLLAEGGTDEDWRQLCEFWASDFRTHITDARWGQLIEKIPTFEEITGQECAGSPLENGLPDSVRLEKVGRFLLIEAAGLHLVLNTSRGLAIQSFGYGSAVLSTMGKLDEGSAIGTLAHGFFDDIAYGADFYSGHYIHEPPLSHKVTDLARCEPQVAWDSDQEGVVISCSIKTSAGQIGKKLVFLPQKKTVATHYDFSALSVEPGSRRLAHITINPDFFDAKSLFYAACNGGRKADKHHLSDGEGLIAVDHGKSISRLVSASTALGMTDGKLYLGDAENTIIIEMKRTDCAGVGMMSCARVKESYFARAFISVEETDETSRYRASGLSDKIGPINYCYYISLEKTSNLL